MLEWTGVPFDPPSPGGTRTIPITNVRANLEYWQRVICRGCLGTRVFMGVMSPDLVIDNVNQTLAEAYYGLQFESTTAVLRAYMDHNATGPLSDFIITFSEGVLSGRVQTTHYCPASRR